MDAKDLNDKQFVFQNKCVDAVDEHSEGAGNSYRSKNHCCQLLSILCLDTLYRGYLTGLIPKITVGFSYIYTYVCVCVCVCVEQITNKDLLYSTVDGEGDDNLTSFISFCEN